MTSSFEQLLAFHCAPALAGIKPSNLLCCRRDRHPDLPAVLEEYNRLFAAQRLRFLLLCECPQRFLVLVYREEALARQLDSPDVAALLTQGGYPVSGGLPAVLDEFRARLAGGGDFPHEMGLLLGYPVEDVLGFIEHNGKNYKFSGYWKVYAHERQTGALFLRYSRCRSVLCDRVARGMSIAQLFSAAS